MLAAPAPVRGAGQEEAGAGDTATAGTVAAEHDPADASDANCGQEEGIRSASATGTSTATPDTAAADHAEPVPSSTWPRSSGSQSFLRYESTRRILDPPISYFHTLCFVYFLTNFYREQPEAIVTSK